MIGSDCEKESRDSVLIRRFHEINIYIYIYIYKMLYTYIAIVSQMPEKKAF